MIVFDASYLLIFLRDNMPPARDRNDKPVEKFKERIQFLIASLDASNTIIGIPTPALAEIMVRAGAAGPEYLKQLRRANFVFLPFDTKAAIEAAQLIFAIKKQTGGRLETWAKTKFDIQISAIAKSESAGIIYSDDKDIETHGKRLGITVIRICDLPLPPEPKPETESESVLVGTQQTLNLAPTEEQQPAVTGEEKRDEQTATNAGKDDQRQTTPPHPTPVQGSDSGRAQGEAATEAKKRENEKNS